MANLNDTFEKPEFDWSAISVGDYKLDHSQNFFGKYFMLLPSECPCNADAPFSRSFPFAIYCTFQATRKTTAIWAMRTAS